MRKNYSRTISERSIETKIERERIREDNLKGKDDFILILKLLYIMID